jgi:predicted DNA-binding protein (MmcQ/YjbR family)
MAPERVFRPPYVGARGWIGVRLDEPADFGEIEMFVEDAYRSVATKRQIALLDDELSR